MFALIFYEAVTNAEHTEANLLPCNAAARLQARAESDEVMARIAEVDRTLEQVTRERALRIVLHRWAEIDAMWGAAIRVCEHYGIGKSKNGSQPVNSQIPDQLTLVIPEIVSSSADSCVDTNVQ